MDLVFEVSLGSMVSVCAFVFAALQGLAALVANASDFIGSPK